MSRRFKALAFVWAVLILLLSSVSFIVIRGNRPAQGQAAPAFAQSNGVSGQSVVFQKIGGYTTVANGVSAVVGSYQALNLTGSVLAATILPAANMPNNPGYFKVACTLDTNSTSSGTMTGLSIGWTNPQGNANSYNLVISPPITPSPTTFTKLDAVNFRAANTGPITITAVLLSGTLNYNITCNVEALQ
jgi:hypothetical protein